MESTSMLKQEVNLPQVVFTEKKRMRFENCEYAPLEPKTQKILQKLKKRLDQLDNKITEDRLNASKDKIRHRISRHIAHRIPIDKKELKLFSEGKSAAKMSRRVEGLRQRLRSGFYQALMTNPDLKGRVKKS